MSDQKILEAFHANRAPCTETLGMKVLSFTSEPPTIEVEFEAKYDAKVKVKYVGSVDELFALTQASKQENYPKLD